MWFRPASADVPEIIRLIDAGMSIARFNMSHGNAKVSLNSSPTTIRILFHVKLVRISYKTSKHQFNLSLIAFIRTTQGWSVNSSRPVASAHTKLVLWSLMSAVAQSEAVRRQSPPRVSISRWERQLASDLMSSIPVHLPTIAFKLTMLICLRQSDLAMISASAMDFCKVLFLRRSWTSSRCSLRMQAYSPVVVKSTSQDTDLRSYPSFSKRTRMIFLRLQ